MIRFYELKRLVTFAETNVVGNVYFTNYLKWQGECREHFLAQHTPGVLDDLRKDLALVTVSVSCDFYTELFAMDTVSIRMSLIEADQNRVTMRFDYYRDSTSPAQLVACGRQTIATMRRGERGLESVPIPVELADALAGYAPPTSHGLTVGAP